MDICELIFQRKDQVLLHFRLDRAEVCIGSNPTNDVVVPDPTVADVAALLMDLGAHRYRLRDFTGQTIHVNAEPIASEEVELRIGDLIEIGDYALKLARREPDGDRRRFGQTELMGPKTPQASLARVRCREQSYEVRAETPFNIGGHPDNHLTIQDPFVSSFHCRITHQDGRWFLSDLESTNGTEVNGLRVKEAELPTPASIQVGQDIVRFDVPSSTSDRRVRNEVFDSMLGESPSMHRVFDLIERFANATEPVLITGESGTGKELVARALHDASDRSEGPFLALNCGGLGHGLIEAELFGYMKGAFTGANQEKLGAFEATSGGTLFLDEIGELSLDLQPKLLRVLESSSIRRVGGTKEISVDTRIVAATHQNLQQRVEEGDFREDLFHRLFVLSIRTPPLSERPQDILPLARHFLKSAQKHRMLDDSAEAKLTDYTWPGNIRELRNVMTRAVVMTAHDVITGDDLVFYGDAFTKRSKDARRSVRQRDQNERLRLVEALEKSGGNRAQAARNLGLSRSTLHDRLKRYGIK